MNRYILTYLMSFIINIGLVSTSSAAACSEIRLPCTSNSCQQAFASLKLRVQAANKLFVLVRHTANGDPVQRSCVDQTLGLTEPGFKQAGALKDVFRNFGIAPKEVFSSTSCRALQTAETVFPNASVTEDSNLLGGACNLIVNEERGDMKEVVYVTHSQCLGQLDLESPSAKKNYGITAFFDASEGPGRQELLGCIWPEECKDDCR